MKFSILLIVFSTLVKINSYSQNVGYMGRKLEISAITQFSGNWRLINDMRYGEKEDIPKGFSVPTQFGIGVNYSILKNWGIGLNCWTASNFVGYRVPKHPPFYVDNIDFPFNSDDDVREYVYTEKNHSIRTYYYGINIRFYEPAFIAPAGNYFDFSLGILGVRHDHTDVYKVMTGTNYYFPDLSLPNYPATLVINGTAEFTQPKIPSMLSMSLGYTIRFSIRKIKYLFFDIGIQGTLVTGEKYGSTKDDSDFSLGGFEKMIAERSRDYIQMQNMFKITNKLVYILK